MTAVIDRPVVDDTAGQTDLARTGTPGRANRSRRTSRWLGSRWRAALWLGPLLVVAGLWQAINMGGSPQRIDDEGTYAAQAWAVAEYHSLGHYTYWYDHPPLGWITMGGYFKVTDAIDRYSNAVLAGREFMLVVQLLSVLLLWSVARRLGMSRWASAIALALFSLSPLAVQFHRTVYLDNIATPWLLASFALALTPTRRLWAFAASGLCFAAAVLTKETSLLLLPVLAVLLWQNTSKLDVRRYALAVTASMFVLAGGFYVVYATIKGELVPGPNHVSLINGLKFQLFSRAESGSVFDPSSLGHAHVHQWLHLDPIQPTIAVICTIPMLFVRRMRAIAVGFAVLLAIMLKPGYLPVPYVIAMLPLAALLVAGTTDVLAAWRPARWTRQHHWSPALPALVVVGALGIALTAPTWWVQQRGLFRSDLDQPVASAETWMKQNIPHTDRIAVDDTFWVDLVRAGFPRQNVVWYYKIDTDSAVEKLSPNGWRDYQYITVTDSVRSFPDAFPQVTQALKNSVVVASFGTGDQQVDIRQIQPQGASAVAAQQRTDRGFRSAVEPGLAANPHITYAGDTAAVLRAGKLDARAATTLAALAGQAPITVHALPQDPAEQTAGLPVRSVELSGANRAEVKAITSGGSDDYAPSSVQDLGGGRLRLTWSVEVAPTLPSTT